MGPQSHASQRLAALYRGLIRRLHAAQREAYLGFLRRIPMRIHVEMLPQRIMMSVSAGGAESLINTSAAPAIQTPAIVMTPVGDSIAASSNHMRAAKISVQNTPANNTVPLPQTVVENTSLTFSQANGNQINIDSSWTSVQLRVSHGTLTLSQTNGLSFSSGTGSNNATMKFSGSPGQMNGALNGLIYRPTTGYTGSDTLTIVTANSGLLGLGLLGSSATSTIALTITAPPPVVNQTPVVSVPPSQTTSEGTQLILSGLKKVSVSDADGGGNVEQVMLTATNGTITLGGTSGLTFISGSGTSDQSMTFTGTLANLNAALSPLKFTPVPLFHGAAGITASIDDLGNSGVGGAKTASATVAINVTQVNQPPAVSVPASQIAAENGQLVFSVSAGNPISVSDSDSSGLAEQVTLSSTTGVLTLASTAGIAFTAGANGAGSMTFTGTLAALNTALDGLALSPAANYAGAAALSIDVNDLGNTGTGGALSASGAVSINFVSSLTVTTASDVSDGITTSINALLASPGADGKISLREAILAANNTPGQHEIDFNIAGSGVQTISVTSALPQISNSVIIDGTTEPGYAGTPVVELDGQAAAFGAIGLAVRASNCTFRGLAIYGFSGNGIDVLPVGANNITIQGNYVGINAAGTAIYNGVGIVLANSSNDLVGGSTPALRNVISGNFSQGIHLFGAGSTSDVITGNYIGTNPAGTTAVPNGTIGIFVDGASGNSLGLASAGGGNLISGNGSYGIEIGGTSPAANVIQGNIIGLNASGTGGLSNGNDGIYLNAATTTLIGGTTSAARNFISGNSNSANTSDGIWINAGSANTIQGNYIGLDISGNVAQANYASGILIQNSPNNLVGGTTPGAGNIISGNGSYGLEISGLSATGNVVQGNYLGTNAAGAVSVSNGNDGVVLINTTANTIGGSAGGAGNLISGNNNVPNSADGIWINGGSANTVQGNMIGTDAAGTGALGNYHDGIDIQGSTNNIIGGGGAPNIIAHNGKGVVVWGNGSAGNAIRANSIYSNTTIGIDLGDDGVTANAGTINSSLPNSAMNFPVFTAVSLAGTTLTVTGYVGSAANQSAFAGAAVDIFKSDQSGANGQGQIYLGTLTADGNGNLSGTLTVSGLTVGDQITATATDPSGNTSEFAANAAVQLVNQPPVIGYPTGQSTGENAAILFSNSRGNAITISDTDANGGIEQLTLSVSSGILTLSQTTGLAFQNSTADGSALLTFNGTLSDINAALNGLVYSPAEDFTGSLTLNINANDLGHTGAGGAQSSNATVTLSLTPVANTPSVTSATTAVDAQTSSGLVITPNPLDGNAQGYYQITNIAGGTLFLNDGRTPLTNGEFIPFAEGAAGLKFTPTTNSVSPGSFDIQASTGSSGELVGAPVTANITVTGTIQTAHTPSVTDSTTDGNQQTTDGLEITSNQSDAQTPIWFRLTHITGGTLFMGDGITPVSEGDFITANQGNDGLKFTPSLNSTAAGHFDVQASLSNDASGLGGNIVTATITIAPLTVTPAAPVNSVPPAQSTAQDRSLVFARTNGNAITISDPGSDGSAEQVTLSATQGTLTLATTGGLTIIAGTGSGDRTVTVTGSLTSINAALEGLTFNPSSHYNGAAAIRILTQDISLSGSGTGLAATSDVPIRVTPAVIPPPAVTPQPIQISIPQAAPALSPPPSGAPILALPVLGPTGFPSGGAANAPGADNSPAGSDQAAPSRSLPTDEHPKAAPAAALTAVPASVAPVVPRGFAPRGAEVQVTPLPDAPRTEDLSVAPADMLFLSPGERLALELAARSGQGALPTGAMMAITNRNYTYLGSKPTAFNANSLLWHDLDRMEEQMVSEHKIRVVAGTASMVSVGVSVAYFMWAVRAGSVLSSLLSSMPAWKLVDPLPILDQVAGSRAGKRARESEEDDETLESMVEGEAGAT